MSAENFEIVKNQDNRFSLFVDGDFIKDYSRKSDALRGYERLRAAAAAGAAEATLADAAAAQPPASNTGGRTGAEQRDVHSVKKTNYVMVNGRLKEIILRQGHKTAAHIDTLTFTLTKDVFIDHETQIDDAHPENVRNLAEKISETLHTIFGFGIYEQKNGINGYKYSFVMGTDSVKYGVAAFGGLNQRDSIMIHLYGDGLTAALDGWEKRLYSWFSAFAPFAKITRCDLAHDFFNGEYTPDQAYTDWQSGGYDNRHMRPRARMHGYDWLDDQRTGKTFYIGTPTSSRMVRIYDKGCEQGDKSSPWVRFELQIRNRDYIIPHDILINAGGYLTASYPVAESLFSVFKDTPAKPERIKKTEKINLEHVVKYASQSSSPCINALEWLGFDAGEILTLLKGGKSKKPKRLGADKSDCKEANAIYIHQMKHIAQQHNSEVYSYMRSIRERENQQRFQERMDKLAEEAMFYKMKQSLRFGWQAKYLDDL